MVTEKNYFKLKIWYKDIFIVKDFDKPTNDVGYLTAGFVQIVMFASDTSNVLLRNPRADSFQLALIFKLIGSCVFDTHVTING